MGNETRRILDLMAQGKITADEAEQLISAIHPPQENGSSATAPPPAGEGTAGSPTPPIDKKPPKWLRVVVFRQRPLDNGAGLAGAGRQNDVDVHLGPAGRFTFGYQRKGEVNVRIPMALVRAGMKLGAMMPGMAGEQVNRHLRERGIDLSKIDPAHIEDVMKELGDMTIDVDDGKHQVRVFCE